VRRLVALVLVAGCASAGSPPGGPERHTPPEIVAVNPDSGATNVKAKTVEIQFDEVVSDRAGGGVGVPSGSGSGSNGLDNLFLISPRTGSSDVSWHRSRISVRPHDGFRPNTAYRITILPGLVDLRGNVRKEARTILFSTGATFPPFSIPGRIFDWSGQKPVGAAYVEALPKADTTIAYVAVSDTTGQFELGPLPQGEYLVRGLMDQNANRTIDRNEKWDTLTVNVQGTNSLIELDAIERDTTAANIDNVSRVDSLTLRVNFDKALDPRLPLQPALVHLVRADSTPIEITGLQWQSAFDRDQVAKQQAAADSARRADTSKAAARPPATPAPALGGRTPPPPPKPKLPAPDKGFIITVSPTTPINPGNYVITVRGMRNLLGKSEERRRQFEIAKPAPRDTTTKARPDSVRRPPGRPPILHRG
jgi:hypothetical protein